ncbi:MAG: TatD family hydrolase [Bacteroidales bacterium]|jgi:TatD DNase family protein|nr:TatD family hydrolase [Bacteroidales bacterium]
MPQPLPGDLIDIHTHDSIRAKGVFAVENLMLHEGKIPDDTADAFSVGIHPWFINRDYRGNEIEWLAAIATDKRIVAVGEAGYDMRRGPSVEIQRELFEIQAELADSVSKPLIIHCVKGWDELLASKRRIKPRMPWIIHGFNGSPEQAAQLTGGNFHLSMWVKSVLNGSLGRVLREVPTERIFLESDGFDETMDTIYLKAAEAVGIDKSALAETIRNNYLRLFVR